MACEFEDLDVNYIGTYRNVRGGSGVESSISVHSYRSGSIDCSKFRQSKAFSGDYKLSSWTFEEDLLQAIIVNDLFDGDKNRFDMFVADQILSLELFRKYFFNYGPLRSRKIDEVTVFQPIFQIFLKGFLDDLRPANDLENFMANNDVIEKEIRNKFGRVVRLSGRTDVIIMQNPSDAQEKQPRRSICHIELKAPYGSLYHSNSQSSIDQLMAETDCISAMRNANTAGVENRSTTLGALTDIFSIYLMYHDRRSSNREFFVTADSSLDPLRYIKSLLTLCLSVDALAAITTTAAVVVENSLSATLSATGAGDGGDGHDGDDDDDDDDAFGGEDANEEEDGDDVRYKKAKQGSSHGEKVGQDSVYEFNFKDEDEQEEWEEKMEFLRQCEMKRLGTTLTISNIIAHGGDPSRYY